MIKHFFVIMKNDVPAAIVSDWAKANAICEAKMAEQTNEPRTLWRPYSFPLNKVF